MHNYFNKNEGFTLVEMLIAITISSTILLMVYATNYTFIRSSVQGSIISNYFTNINMAARRIDTDILNAYWDDESKGAYFIAKLEVGFSRLTFVTVERKNYRMINNIKEDSPSSDIHEVGYYLKKNDTGQYDLIRRSLIHYDKSVIDENNSKEEEGEDEIILKNVKSLKFSFRSGNDWTDKWDTREGMKLPPGIRTTLIVLDLNNNEDTYEFFTTCNMR